MGFSAYGVTQSDDPLSQALRGLIDHAAAQEHQIALLWQTIEKLSAAQGLPVDAAVQEHFDAAGISRLLGK
jgi:serine O-acetyltransferase